MKRKNAELVLKLHELNLTQTKLAREAGVCLTYVNKWIRGRLKLKSNQVEAIISGVNRHLPPWAQLSVSDYLDEVV